MILLTYPSVNPTYVCLVAQSYLILWDSMDCNPRLLSPWDFPGKNTGAGCHFLLQDIFLTQGSNRHLLHGRRSPLGHLEAPGPVMQHILEVAELPTSMLNTSHSFQPPHQSLTECLHFTKALLRKVFTFQHLLSSHYLSSKRLY